KKVLEIGCGRAELVRSFNELGVEAYGVDVSEYSIKSGLERAPFLKGKLFLCDIDKKRLPFRNNYFDFIIMINTIEHVFSLRRCIEEVKRVLKPGGYVFLVTHIPGSEHDVNDRTHVNVRTKEEWIKLFERHCLYLDKKLEQIVEERTELNHNNQIEKIKMRLIEKLYIKFKPSSSKEGIALIKAGKDKERETRVWNSIFRDRIVLAFYKCLNRTM
ncbi:MAG: class I SAM-dependent methyltransferase, partial [Patescibacteria group bacterium]